VVKVSEAVQSSLRLLQRRTCGCSVTRDVMNIDPSLESGTLT
jgi:hypothetical protein